MAISGKIGTVAWAFQSAKGTPAAAPLWRSALSASPSVRPIKERARYVTTDTSRDPGPAYTSAMRVEGEFQVYMQPELMASLHKAVLGSSADSGVTPNFMHAGTPADDLPWVTLWRNVGGVILEKHIDCKFGRLAVEGSSNSPFMVTIGYVGVKSQFLPTDPVLARIQTAGLLFMEGAGAYLHNAVAQKISRLSYEVNNGIGAYYADDYIPDDIDVGERTVSLSCATRFQGPLAFPKYREFFYGADAGTDQSAAVGTAPFQATILRNANLGVIVSMPQVAFSGGPMPQADPGGAPIDVDVTFDVEKPAGSPIVTLTAKDQQATV